MIQNRKKKVINKNGELRETQVVSLYEFYNKKNYE